MTARFSIVDDVANAAVTLSIYRATETRHSPRRCGQRGLFPARFTHDLQGYHHHISGYVDYTLG
jgi:hypothetical protein